MAMNFDADAVVVGAGHNGLICAAYLARAGLNTVLVEARDRVGGTADSETFAGATVNICNCDHITFRTTPVIEELRLERFGLSYIDVEPGQFHQLWDDPSPWALHHDVDATIDALAKVHPDQADGYRRYARAAVPIARMILEVAASGPPRAGGLVRAALAQGGRGAPTLVRWSRASARTVLRRYVSSESVIAPAMAIGPVVWGAGPDTPGTGLGALGFALRHVGRVGRPIGGSGMVPQTLLAAFEHHGGDLRTSMPVGAILCDGPRVVGVETIDGSVIRAPIVVSACDPRRTLVEWLRNPPSQVTALADRWRVRGHQEGYESKLDLVLDAEPRFRDGHEVGPTTVITPSSDDLSHAHSLLGSGRVAQRPVLFVNVPTALDATLAPPGRHVMSVEVLYTPYSLPGGWADSPEPRRWLDLLAERMEPGFLDSIVDWRAMTPDRYEREFHLPLGHAASFAGGPLAALRATDPELTRYTTPVEGLFLTGAGTFPGAGIWGASGRNAALTVLARH